MGRALGELEKLVLLAVVELDDEAYGAEVGRAIEHRTGRSISSGSIYTALDRMESRGLIQSHVGEPTPERGGRRRKYYRVEPAGAGELHDALEAMRAMARGVLPRLRALAAGEAE